MLRANIATALGRTEHSDKCVQRMLEHDFMHVIDTLRYRPEKLIFIQRRDIL